MAVLSLFETPSQNGTRAGRTGARARSIDLGRLPREHRVAFYHTACDVLGLDASTLPLRFVRCNDGRLRLFDPTRPAETPASSAKGSGMVARLERELTAGTTAVAAGGGIAYDIDLETGDLRVREVVRATREAMPLPGPTYPRRRRA